MYSRLTPPVEIISPPPSFSEHSFENGLGDYEMLVLTTTSAGL